LARDPIAGAAPWPNLNALAWQNACSLSRSTSIRPIASRVSSSLTWPVSAPLGRRMQHILVFEDDIQFHGFSHRNLSRAARFLRQNPQWDLFFLGCWVKSSRKTRCPSVVHVRYLCAAHAYAINRAFAERLVQMPWRGWPLTISCDP